MRGYAVLVRAIVATKTLATRKRVSGILKRIEVVVEDRGRRCRSIGGMMERNVDLIIIESGYLGAKDLAASVGKLRPTSGTPGVVVLTYREDPDERAALLAAGCEAVLNLALQDAALAGALETIARRRREVASIIHADAPRSSRPQLSDFASESASMKALIDMAERVVSSDTSLLIQGETGVGKEWLARAIHARCRKPNESFVAVNCAALPEQLLESELFGHEAGAFPGATRAHRGAFEMAHRGTIFLDEIGAMPLRLQAKLLRVLQDQRMQRAGSEREIILDVRVMAASTRDLQEAMQAKSFRQDLFYRLGLITFTVPPLRERVEDIPALAEGYARHFSRKLGKHVERLSSGAMEALLKYKWPGNVQELINVMERAVLLCRHHELLQEHLPVAIAKNAMSSPSGSVSRAPDGDLILNIPEDWKTRPLSALKGSLVDSLEKEYLTTLLSETKGNIGLTAERAGLNVRSLFNMMRRHGLHKETFKRVPS
jgi:DNA-binding NtrC family response regulator